MKNKVILIAGKKRAGKDYAGEIIKQFMPGIKCVRFADTIKEIISSTFGISLEDLEEYKNNTDQYGLEIKAYPNNQPEATIKYINFREILQKFGTEGMKPIFGDDIWVEACYNKIKDSEYSIITDFRFLSEYKSLLEKGFEIYTIKIFNDNLESDDSHSSENDLENNNFVYDFYIDNTNKPDITEDIKDILNSIFED